MAAGIYAGEERFFQVVTLMAPSFANNSWWEFYNLLLWQSSQHFQTMQAIQDKGFIRHFPKWELETPASHIGSVTPWGESSPCEGRALSWAQRNFRLSSNIYWATTTCQTRKWNESRSEANHEKEKNLTGSPPPPGLIHRPLPQGGLSWPLSHLLYTPIASDSSLCDSPHTSHYSIPVNPTALLDLWGWDWVPGSQVSVLA